MSGFLPEVLDFRCEEYLTLFVWFAFCPCNLKVLSINPHYFFRQSGAFVGILEVSIEFASKYQAEELIQQASLEIDSATMFNSLIFYSIFYFKNDLIFMLTNS